ncbi:MAG TPA: C-terminal binding protein [Xanthobacteraceae bacterium]|nr:C-terminal binding protein [Xanthobacteraceae bacterium]
MPRPVVAVADSPFPSLDPVKAALQRIDAELRLAKSGSESDILEVARDADGLMVCYAQITPAVIAGLTRCKVIARTGLGVDNIDLPSAKAKGITVTYVPDYCLQEVSDHTVALLLSLVRKIPLSNRLVQAGRWEMPAVVPIHRLEGRTLGLIGFGNIPRAVTPKAQAFGLKVITSDPYVAREHLERLGVENVSLDALYARADFVSVHAPLTPETRGLVNADAFAKMKPGVMIVNTARGPLIDQKALVAALDSGKVAGAALDVLEQEPPPKDLPLAGRDNVILTPHTAFYSVEALQELQTKAATDVAKVLSGEKPVYPVKMP